MARRRASRRTDIFGGTTQEPGPGHRYAVGGRPFRCQHCAFDGFRPGRAQLNTRGLTFFGLDWMNRGAHLLECRRCGLIAWFSVAPDAIQGEPGGADDGA